MGARFELIADKALKSLDPVIYKECQFCAMPDVPVYKCHGYLVREDGFVDEDYDRCAACENCLKQGRVAHLNEYQTDPLVERYASDIAKAKALLRRTPRIPVQLQKDDWPICCGHLAEFAGSPTSYDESKAIPGQMDHWESGFCEWHDEFSLEPESLDEVSIFRCHNCGRLSFTWQHT